MSTKFMVEVEGDDTDPESTIREAARVLAVAFHSVVSARDMSSAVSYTHLRQCYFTGKDHFQYRDEREV